MTIAIETPVGGHLREQADPTATTLSGRCAVTGYRVSVSSLFPSAHIVDQWRELAAKCQSLPTVLRALRLLSFVLWRALLSAIFLAIGEANRNV